MWTDNDKKTFDQLWNSRYTIQEIANQLGKTYGSVQSYIRRKRKVSVLLPKHNGETSTLFNSLRGRRNRETVEDPPKPIPIPVGVKNVPWNALNTNECQWSMEGYEQVASNIFICCGLSTKGASRFCEHHKRFAKKGWKI